ncbi:hypothetical protein BN946_scf184805.g36 [Trametes cinnabarina]|uniref:Uncharacterized protein n=1 Tax=Pycnoporus cinnabarinus TaxID=5643 RepID=A0A060S370_PYCCI|nr:hypothetical protein BN946_scf184805.g36 [Trametes cinnabarina]
MELDMQQVRDTALEVLKNIVQEGKVHEFTYGKYRRKVEEAMDLEPGTLAAPEYKAVVNAIAEDFINSLEKEEQEIPAQEDVPVEQKKSSTTSRKRTNPPQSSEKAAKGRSVAKDSAKGKKAARSASVVASSEDEADFGTESSAAQSKSRLKAPSKQKRVESDSETLLCTIQTDAVELAVKHSKKVPSPAHGDSPASRTSQKRTTHDNSNDAAGKDEPRSESEMSVVIDEPPPKKRKQKKESEDSHTAKASKSKKRKSSTQELSKDEETIKRLKSLVLACGVRKVWSKEFMGLERSSDQIRRLRQILSDLGMTGRMSMEQAKAIKAKREFEKELQDVQEFASKVTSGPSRRDRREDDQGTDEEDDLSEVEPVPKRRTARQSIMAFLGDESE